MHSKTASFAGAPGRRRSCNILYVLITFLFACNMPDKPSAELLEKRELPGFSSASAIDFHDGRLYVTGDDARHLLVLDKNYAVLDSISLFPGDGLRIPKKEKTDLEASAIIAYNGRDQLLVAGSGSTSSREVFLLFPLDSPRNYSIISSGVFWKSLHTLGLRDINIEGLTAVNGLLVFANRAHLGQPDNHLVITGIDALAEASNPSWKTILLELEHEPGAVKGVSGLAYVPSLDLLLFTVSVEETASTFDDGAIGDSFLGYVTGFSKSMNEPAVKPAQLLNLSAVHPDFKGEKIESVCVESFHDGLVLHLAADNDDGSSTLFKVSLRLQ